MNKKFLFFFIILIKNNPMEKPFDIKEKTKLNQFLRLITDCCDIKNLIVPNASISTKKKKPYNFINNRRRKFK